MGSFLHAAPGMIPKSMASTRQVHWQQGVVVSSNGPGFILFLYLMVRAAARAHISRQPKDALWRIGSAVSAAPVSLATADVRNTATQMSAGKHLSTHILNRTAFSAG